MYPPTSADRRLVIEKGGYRPERSPSSVPPIVAPEAARGSERSIGKDAATVSRDLATPTPTRAKESDG